MNRLVIDITYLAHWRGKLTGVPRVINELVVRYADEADCVFVVWSNLEDRFYEVDLASTLLSRGIKPHYALKNARAGYLKLAFAPIGISIRLFLKSRNKYHAPIPRSFLRVLGSAHKVRFRRYSPQPTDTFFVPLGEWPEKAYADTLVQYHKKGIRLIHICYDMLPIVTPQYSGHSTDSMKSYNKVIFPICDLILTISEFTKQDIINWLQAQKLPASPIEVFRLGEDFLAAAPHRPTQQSFVKSGLKGGDYILCVGTVEARKNHTLLYYAYKLAGQQELDLPKVLIVGRRGYRTDNIYDIITHDPVTKNKMIFLTNTSDEELSWLYDHALFSIYPSFYEGWGLPIAESIAHKLPCLASNSSSMPEIAGNLIPYFNPASPEDCLKAIKAMLAPGAIDKAKKKLEAYKPTSWDQTFHQVDRLIKEAHGSET